MGCRAGTFSVAKKCMFQQQHKGIVGCDLDLVCFNLGLPQVALVFVRQVLNKESDITEEEDEHQAAFTFVNAKGGGDLDQKCRIDVWETFSGSTTMQTFLLLKLYHLST